MTGTHDEGSSQRVHLANADRELLRDPLEHDEATSDASTPSRASGRNSRRSFIFFICAISLLMVSVDQTIVATGLPRIGGALHARINWLSWTITIYSVGQTIMLPMAGRLSDRFGRKRFYVACAVLFTVASVACGLSTSIYMLVPFRLAQSIGGGGFLPSASGIVADHFGEDRDRALGFFSSIFPIGGIAGPIFGGLITQYWDWRGIFFVNLPIGVALIVLIVRYVPSTPRQSADRMDLSGIGLLMCTMITGMVSIASLGQADVSALSVQVIVPSCLAVVFGWLFFRHLGRTDVPVIPRMLISGRGFAVMNIINVLFGGAGFGFGVLLPLYAENRYHFGLSSAGTVLSAQAIGMMLCAAVASILIRRTGYRRPMAYGFVVVAFSLVMLSIGARGSPYFWLASMSLITGIGLGCVAPAANNATLRLAPTQVAAISGLRATFRQTGSILCVSTITAILARSANPGIAQAHIFWVLAGLILVASGLTFAVPEGKGSW